MWYFIIIVSVIWVAFFVWLVIGSKKRNREQDKDKPPFRTEEELQEYGKPMVSHPVDFDDEE